MKPLNKRIVDYIKELMTMMDENQAHSFSREEFELIIRETAKSSAEEQKAFDTAIIQAIKAATIEKVKEYITAMYGKEDAELFVNAMNNENTNC